MKRVFAAFVFAALGGLVVACAGSDGNQDPTSDTSTQSEDLKSKHCGSFAKGSCPSGYYCDMSDVPPGNVGGSGVCKKEHSCVLNGVIMCPKGESFDTSVCHCK
jgi:hypothetical protein